MVVKQRVAAISAVVLAGGASKRLGMDKALLEINGEWLLQRTLNTLAALSDDLLVVARDKATLADLAVRVVQDVVPGRGTLMGIYTGLQSMRHQRGLFVACDMPFLNPSLLRYMILLSSDFDVVVPRIGSETEPLHAVYSKACLAPIARALDLGQLRVIQFFKEVRVRYVEQQEVEAFDPQHLSFFNINTVADLETARRHIARRAARRRTKAP
jgi:molybdopterin-guanine dinucleotide biosynthesis protein A